MADRKIDKRAVEQQLHEYPENLKNLSNADLWGQMESWIADLTNGDMLEDFIWNLAALFLELRRRLEPWFDWAEGKVPPLPAFSGNARCPKCGATEPGTLKTRYCAGRWDDGSATCFLREEARMEHMHRTCSECGYEWLEACADHAGPEAEAARTD